MWGTHIKKPNHTIFFRKFDHIMIGLLDEFLISFDKIRQLNFEHNLVGNPIDSFASSVSSSCWLQNLFYFIKRTAQFHKSCRILNQSFEEFTRFASLGPKQPD